MNHLNQHKSKPSSNRLTNNHRATTIIFGVLLLTGCNTSMEDLDEYFIEQREIAATPISPIPEVTPYLRYVYPKHEKDPFNFAMLSPQGPKKIIDNGIELDTTRVPEFLEGFPLDSLKMVGTVEKDDVLWALIRVPDGAVQSVKTGNYMGQNYGKITNIVEGNMDLKETVANGTGGYKERNTSMILSQK